MTTMLEKVAKEIGDADGSLGDYDFGWEANPEGWREKHRRTARAALLAIREPDGAMLAAGRRSLDGPLSDPGPPPGQWTGERIASGTFTAMIDAILNEKPEGGA